MSTIYDYTLCDKKGNEVSLEAYKGKVILVVNTATGCGFTPQYEELEAVYHRLKERGLEILDVPCNQFGHQAPGSDEEIQEFCQLKFGADFPQFKKSDVNGDNQLPLYAWLKSQKGFEGFDPANPKSAGMEQMFDKTTPGWRESSDIKWNFTKFLINREGQVVARFEPVDDLKKVEECILQLL